MLKKNMNKPIIVANWKMNPNSVVKVNSFFNSIKKEISPNKKTEIVFCPPFVYLNDLKKSLSGFLKLGAQDCFWEKKGAYTGGISVLMLKDLGCEYVIIGHSERRKYFNETNIAINKKLKAVLSEKINPVLCIGESKEQKSKGRTKRALRQQIKSALKGISGFQFKNLNFCVAYEPIWAIGSKKPCDFREVKKVAFFIRKIISEIYNAKIAEKILILYGGSVDSRNVTDYIDKAGLQGVIVGGVSLNAKDFIKITKTIS